MEATPHGELTDFCSADRSTGPNESTSSREIRGKQTAQGRTQFDTDGKFNGGAAVRAY